MKHIGKFLLLVIASFAMSCDAIPFLNDTYYVKFEGGLVEDTFINESVLFAMQAGNHIQSVETLHLSETLGPVSKDARIYITAEGTTNFLCDEIFIKIYVSRNNEPFTLVAGTNGVGTASLSYTIDF